MAPSTPRLHSDVYPFIYPAKYRGALDNQVVIVTGSAGALGHAAAECFAVAGARLVLVHNRTPPAPKEHFKALGARDAIALRCDVADLSSCEELVRCVLEAYGRVDVLINNAGANSLVPMHDQEPQNFIHEMGVNFHGPYYLMRLLMPEFRARRRGCVLNIASRAGTLYIPFSTGYCASKAALINLTGCVQKEVDVDGLHDIHLYALHPGGVQSEMTLNKYKNAEQTLPDHPERAKQLTARVDAYNDSPYLNGMACVVLATGIAKDLLRGRYYDVGQDLEDVLALGPAAIGEDGDLYTLHTRYKGEVPQGGSLDAKFDFPGF